MDFRTFTPSYKTLYGIYTDDFITFGEYKKDAGNPIESDETLLKICDDNDTNHSVTNKVTFRFKNNQLTFKKEVNSDFFDTDIEHAVPENIIVPVLG